MKIAAQTLMDTMNPNFMAILKSPNIQGGWKCVSFKHRGANGASFQIIIQKQQKGQLVIYRTSYKSTTEWITETLKVPLNAKRLLIQAFPGEKGSYVEIDDIIFKDNCNIQGKWFIIIILYYYYNNMISIYSGIHTPCPCGYL